jgi:hypothetical protein
MTRWEYAQVRGSYDEARRVWAWVAEFPPDLRSSVDLGSADRLTLLNEYGAQGWDIAASSDVKTIRHGADGSAVEFATGVRYILRRAV